MVLFTQRPVEVNQIGIRFIFNANKDGIDMKICRLGKKHSQAVHVMFTLLD